jgi:2,6-dihydroxypyridine 3-monooxygenase
MRPERIAIVGGSVAGLSLALALRGHGIATRIYERSTGLLAHEGAGLMMARPVVEHIGLRSTRPVTQRLTLGASGRVLWEQPVEKHAVGWGDVYGALRQRVGAVPLEEGSPVRQVIANPPGLRTDRYGEERFDFIVGADGIGSLVRNLLDPGFSPRYLGYVAVRGLVPRVQLPTGMPDATDGLFGEAMAKVLLEGEHVTAYGLPGEDEPLNWMWYMNVPERELERLLTDRDGIFHPWSMPASLLPATTDSELRARARERLPAWLAALVRETRTLFLQPVWSGFADRMAGPGLALVGDAAHLAVPHVGGGVTLALQDSMELADVLAGNDGDLDDRLQRWAEVRQASNRPRLEFAVRLGLSLQSAGKDWETWSPARFEAWWNALLGDAPPDKSR